jgi:hypothetical protein
MPSFNPIDKEETEMRRKLSLLLAALFIGALPMGAAAMSHEHGKMEHGEHGGMMMEGGMVMLGDQTVDGVKAMAHVKDVKAAMAKMGMKETHHFMVAFVDAAGKPITEGTVAVKITAPDGKEGAPVSLMGMEGHFGADVALAAKGAYGFKVGTKLPDGKTRQYEFKYEVK